jgi:hypothetical protein
MKYLLIALLVLINPLATSAQKQYTYTDAALSLAYLDPGFSSTYNYNIVKHLGIGAGMQAYVFHPATTNPRTFTPAIFADVRFRIRPEHISQYFMLVDLGMDFYKHNDDYTRDGNYVYTVPKDNGVYFGLGIGYFLRLTYRGWGAYTTLKLINNIYTKDQLSIATGDQRSLTSAGGTFVMSLGFRFGDDNKKPPPEKDLQHTSGK